MVKSRSELLKELDEIDKSLLEINIKSQDKETHYELESLLEEELYNKAYENSYGFLMGSWNTFERNEFVQSKHLHAMGEHLDACLNGQIKNLAINLSPRNSKTSLTTRAFPAYCWIKDPTLRFINISYSAQLAVDDAVASKQIINSEWYKKGLNTVWKELNNTDNIWTLSTDKKNQQHDYYNTAHGRRFATSTGGTLTGAGGDIIIIDDPLSANDAHSKLEKTKCNQWSSQVLSSRLDNKETGRKILVMQRLDVDDLSGYLREQGGWEFLILPMEWDESKRYWTSIGWTDWRTKSHELMNPGRFSDQSIKELKLELGEYGYAAQYQQEPAIIGGGLIKEKWWQHWYILPNEFDGACIAMDLNNKKGDNNDNTAIIVIGRKENKFYVIDLVYGNMDIIEQLESITNICNKYPNIRARLIEDKGNGSPVWTMLNRTITGLIPVDPKGIDKVTRIMSIVPVINAGNLNIPDKNVLNWIAPLLKESEQFPKGKHDDCLDALAYGIDYLLNNNCYTKLPASLLIVDDKKISEQKKIKNELMGDNYGLPIKVNNKYVRSLFN